ncbi:hypothetical protein [Candidatus Palauibacter sp.]|uniref:hypothetical protein n=1 Tax=Candidatus Palauibacter sp. TaxID=3101350 RepID=UPI003AF2C9C1
MPEAPASASFRAMLPRNPILHARLLAALVFTLATLACDDPFAAFLGDVPLAPTEVTLYDYVTARLEDPPAFDVVLAIPARVDQTLNWDFLFQIRGGVPELVPFSAATDSVTDSGLRITSERFEALLEAPEDGYTLNAPVTVRAGDVLIARSRVDPTQFLACSRYAKLHILAIDPDEGTITFRHLANPNCGDTVLEPGQHGSL